MKAKLTSSQTVKTNVYQIDYKNGVVCHIVKEICFENDHSMLNYHFIKDDIRYTCISNIDELVLLDWNDHSENMKEIKFNNINDLEDFKDFDKLYYIGCGYDGLIHDINGYYKSSRIKLTDTFFSIYCNIKTREKAIEFKEKFDKLTQVENCNIVTIPYYNGGGESITCELVGLDDDLYNSLLNKKHLSDEIKREIVETLLGEKFIK